MNLEKIRYIIEQLDLDIKDQINILYCIQFMSSHEVLMLLINHCREQNWWSDINRFLLSSDDPLYYVVKIDRFVDLIYDYLKPISKDYKC